MAEYMSTYVFMLYMYMNFHGYRAYIHVLLPILSLLLTVRALILDLRSEPDSPIPGSDNNAGCLLADSEVKIVCENIAFPVGTVVFEKDSTDIVLTDSNTRCVSCVCSNVQLLYISLGV